MSRTSVSIVGSLRFPETDGLQFSITIGKGDEERTVLVDTLPNADDWTGLGVTSPARPLEFPNEAAEQEWRGARDAYVLARNSDPKYRQACLQFAQVQEREPQNLYGLLWFYRHNVCRLISTEPKHLRDNATDRLLVKQYVLRRERYPERVRREV